MGSPFAFVTERLIMFESIRKHSRVVMIVLFLLIIPSFVLVGIDSNYFSEKSPVVARVDGQKITQSDWDQAHRAESDRLRAQSPDLDPKLLDTSEARYATLERLVRDKVVQLAASKMLLVTSDARLARSLAEVPAIAALRRPDGSLDAEGYRALVAAQGLTPDVFEANVRRELSQGQVLGPVTAAASSSQEQARIAMDALYQRREVQYAKFNPAEFASKVTVSDPDLDAYYRANTAKFQQAEQVSVDYVVLDLESVRSSITLSEDDLRTYYKENAERLAGKEERRASHILINAPKSASTQEREKAKAIAQDLLAQVRKTPAAFAEVAKKSSQDPGSAPNGGDLGFFSRGAMVKAFEDAVFALNKGDISDVIETEFGFHIISVVEIKSPKPPAFESVRSSLEAELKQQFAQRKYAEVAETFANAVYEQSDSLQPIADKLKLKLVSVPNVQRTPSAGAPGPLNNAKLLEAIFSAESIASRRNTEAVEIGPNQMVSARITEYTPARVLPFAEVKDRVRALYVAQKSADLARAEGQARLADWKAASGSVTALGNSRVMARDLPDGQPRALVDAVMAAKVDTLPAWIGVDLGSQGYAVVRISKLSRRDTVAPAQSRTEQLQIGEWWGGVEASAYYEWLKRTYNTQIKVERPRPVAALGLS